MNQNPRNSKYNRVPQGKVHGVTWQLLAQRFTDTRTFGSPKAPIHVVTCVHLVCGIDPKKLFWNHWTIHLETTKGQYFRLDMTGIGEMTIRSLPPIEPEENESADRKSLDEWMIDEDERSDQQMTSRMTSSSNPTRLYSRPSFRQSQ
ncbi:hypothetical protein GE09DRAFT_1057672 [Coniochaeta sp. 2T2.1]|nr:hypothetical protein GE09DRAFT_1057672 [Coniochaeta sp. 2T2.1]